MPLPLAQRASYRYVTRSHWQKTAFRRSYSSENAGGKQRSAHAQWYAEVLPGMVPIALLGSAVYVVRVLLHSEARSMILLRATSFQGLRFLQAKLSQERYVDEARAKVQELEREVEILRKQESRGATAVAAPPIAGEGYAKRRGWLW